MMCIMAEAIGGIPDARAAARVIEKLNKLLPAMELDTEPLLEEAEREPALIFNLELQMDY